MLGSINFQDFAKKSGEGYCNYTFTNLKSLQLRNVLEMTFTNYSVWSGVWTMAGREKKNHWNSKCFNTNPSHLPESVSCCTNKARAWNTAGHPEQAKCGGYGGDCNSAALLVFFPSPQLLQICTWGCTVTCSVFIRRASSPHWSFLKPPKLGVYTLCTKLFWVGCPVFKSTLICSKYIIF